MGRCGNNHKVDTELARVVPCYLGDEPHEPQSAPSKMNNRLGEFSIEVSNLLTCFSMYSNCIHAMWII